MDGSLKARQGFGEHSPRLAYILPVLFVAALPLATLRSVNADPEYDRSRLDGIADVLESQLGIDRPVYVEIVAYNRRGFSVQPTNTRTFVLSADANFLRLLDNEELTAALAHELAHVWIYTHHPFLHTENLANQIAMQVVARDSLKDLYVKVWTFYGEDGTIEELLGPEVPETN
jgi:hypothetical protein